MKRMIIATVFVGLFSTAAFSAPLLNQANSIARPSTLAENVRVVCEENGACYRVGPRPVARWVYGDGQYRHRRHPQRARGTCKGHRLARRSGRSSRRW
jgi:hypothetical protein